MNNHWTNNYSGVDTDRLGEFQDLLCGCTSAYSSQRTHDNRLMEVFISNLKAVPVDPSIDPIFSSCFSCWKFGHRYQECPLPRHHTFCVSCGRRNTFIHSCPRCGRAYHLYTLAQRKAKLEWQQQLNRYNHGFSYATVEDYSTQFEKRVINQSDSCNANFTKTFTTNLPEDQYYDSSDDSENYNNAIVDEDKQSHEPFASERRDRTQ